VRDEELVSDRERDVIVVLQDGRQLDGWPRPFVHAFECEHVVFLAYEIDAVYPQ
jgi:hypothetical protein